VRIKLSYILKIFFIIGFCAGIPLSFLYVPMAIDEGVWRVIVALILVPIGSAVSSLTYALVGYPLFRYLIAKNILSVRLRDKDIVSIDD